MRTPARIREQAAARTRAYRARRRLGIVVIRPTIEERFWAKVDESGGPGACWPWLGWTNGQEGYGRFRIRGRDELAHRVSFEMSHGRPARLLVLHRCDSPPCVNPGHLFEGSHDDNMNDMARKKRAPMSVHPESRAFGERSGHARLTDAAVREIRELIRQGEFTRRELAERFGVTRGSIDNIAIRRTWAHL